MSGSVLRQPRPVIDAGLAESVRPTTLAKSHLLPVLPALTGLLPDRGLRRGTTIVVSTLPPDRQGSGITSLGLALTVAASQGGAWCAAVGLADLSPTAVVQAGIALTRFVFASSPCRWASVVAAASGGFDVVLARPPSVVGTSIVRRLTTKVRAHRSVLVVIAQGVVWPEAPDVELVIDSSTWHGLEDGYGCLRTRKVTVSSGGRRSANKGARATLLLPGDSEVVELIAQDLWAGPAGRPGQDLWAGPAGRPGQDLWAGPAGRPGQE